MTTHLHAASVCFEKRRVQQSLLFNDMQISGRVFPPTHAHCDVAVVKPFRPVLKYKLWTYIQNMKTAYSRHFVTITTHDVPTQINGLPLTWLIILRPREAKGSPMFGLESIPKISHELSFKVDLHKSSRLTVFSETKSN